MMNRELRSLILICKDLQKAQDFINEEYDSINKKFFIKDDFLLEDAKEVVKEAYIAEKEQKMLVLSAKSYNIYAQNSLLKILEEPPRNIVFVLISQSKNVFLPTILSRVLLKELEVETKQIDIDLNLKRLDLKDIYDFVQNNSKIDKNDLKELIQEIVKRAVLEYKIDFKREELEYFENLLKLSQLNSKSTNLLISLLLTIKQRVENGYL